MPGLLLAVPVAGLARVALDVFYRGSWLEPEVPVSVERWEEFELEPRSRPGEAEPARGREPEG